jgi:RHS repeat-associated protein
LGSTDRLSDVNGNVTDQYVYQAFGGVQARSGKTTNPYMWVGKLGYYGDPDLIEHYVRGRYYGMGRWISRDPVEFADNNPYRYGRNDPPDRTDPSAMLCNAEFEGIYYGGERLTDLDSKFTTTPHKDLAIRIRQALINKSPGFVDLQMQVPRLEQTGLFTFENPEFSKGTAFVPRGAVLSAWALLFMEWNISEDKKGDCGVVVNEWQHFGGLDVPTPEHLPAATKFPAKADITALVPRGTNYVVAKRKQARGKFRDTIIFVDTPGGNAIRRTIPAGILRKPKGEIQPQSGNSTIALLMDIIDINKGRKGIVNSKLFLMSVRIPQETPARLFRFYFGPSPDLWRYGEGHWWHKEFLTVLNRP